MLALSIWLQQRWAGLRWWSWWRAAWRNQVLWAPVDSPEPWPLQPTRVEHLSVGHPAVRVAAEVLHRGLP